MKVLLVDDEYLIREGLKLSIQWEKFNMELVATAEDGEQALEFVQQYQPDLLITDICMPFLNGLELAERARKENPNIIVVLITAYDDFNFAKQAIRLNITDYILKPIELDYVEQMLKQISLRFYERQRLNKKYFIRKIIDGSVHKDGIQENALKQLGLYSGYYACMLVQILGFSFAEDMLQKNEIKDYFHAFTEEIEQCIGAQTIFLEYYIREGKALAIIAGKEQNTCEKKVEQTRKLLKDNSVLLNSFPFLCATDQAVSEIWKIPVSYDHCQEIARSNAMNDTTIFLDYSESEPSKTDNEIKLSKSIAALNDCIRTFDKKAICQNLDIILSQIQENGSYSTLYSQLLIASVYSQILSVMKEFELDIGEVFDSPMEEYRKIASQQSIQKQIQMLHNMLDQICDFTKQGNKSTHHIIIEKARRYIELHFTEQECSLQSAAESVHISPCYFSILFKQEVGQSFISYLTELRVKKAKQLLEYTDMKSYEIAMAIGYENPTYFSTLFKKNTGFSPKEYRRNCTEKK